MSNDAAEKKGFEGAWLVSEYVYSPSGEFCGVVRQERRVAAIEPGRIRVTQECAPEASLAGGPMEAFAGHHVFDLIADGRARRYLGPAVLGTGLTWGEGAMTGAGMWPEFGHNFTSYAVVAEPTLQLTGGKFFNGPEMVANIVGIAIPQTTAAPEWPEFGGAESAHEVAGEWSGTLRTVKADGEVTSEVALIRRYTQTDGAMEFKEFLDGRGSALRLSLTEEDGRLRVAGRARRAPFQGFGKRYGWATELTLIMPAGRRVEWMEVLDAKRGRLVGVRRWWADGALSRVEVMNLCSKGQ